MPQDDKEWALTGTWQRVPSLVLLSVNSIRATAELKAKAREPSPPGNRPHEIWQPGQTGIPRHGLDALEPLVGIARRENHLGLGINLH